MTKFQMVKEKDDILEEVVDSFGWMETSAENSIKDWKERLETAQEEGQENTEWEENNIERFEYRLSVIQEVKKMLEKML